MYVYMQTEPGLYTVGYLRPNDGKWIAESDHDSEDSAAARARYLNGADDHWINPEPEKEGISLRDYFAARAMQGEMSTCSDDRFSGYYFKPGNEKLLAEGSYRIADAMLAARNKK